MESHSSESTQKAKTYRADIIVPLSRQRYNKLPPLWTPFPARGICDRLACICDSFKFRRILIDSSAGVDSDSESGIRGKLRLIIGSGCAASLDRSFVLGLLSVPLILLSFEDHKIMHVIVFGLLTWLCRFGLCVGGLWIDCFITT